MDDQIADKLRKLLALADERGGGTEAEREVALAKAQELAFRHNLDLLALGDTLSDPDRQFTRDSQTLSVSEYWQTQLLTVLGAYNFVRVYMRPSGRRGARSRQVFMVGRSENIAMVRTLHAHLVTQLTGDLASAVASYDRYASLARGALDTYRVFYAQQTGEVLTEDTAREYLRTAPPARLDRLLERLGGWKPNVRARIAERLRGGDIAIEYIPNLGVFRRTFFHAAVQRIDERLREVHAQLVAEAGTTGTDLVVHEWDAVDRYLESLGVQLQTRTSRATWSEHAAQMGAAAAEAADLGARKLNLSRAELPSGS
jgi:hypothetical protein